MREWINLFESMSVEQALSFFSSKGYDISTPEALKKARNELIRKHHPDNPDGNLDFAKKINQAYDTLKSGYSNTKPDAPTKKEPTETPIWAMAGHSGGYPPQASIYREDFTDLNFFKKRMWELSGKSTEEWTLWNFDGAFFRGVVTVYGSPKIFSLMANAMRQWDRFYNSRAVFVTNKNTDRLLLIWSDMIYHNPPIPFEHDSFNSNPGNDQQFLRKLPAMLDEIEREVSGEP